MIVLPGGTELGSFKYRNHPATIAVSSSVTMSITTTYENGSPFPLAVARVDPHDGSLSWHWSPVTDAFARRFPDLRERVVAATEDLWNHLAWGASLTPKLGVTVTYRRSPPDAAPVEETAALLDLVEAAA